MAIYSFLFVFSSHAGVDIPIGFQGKNSIDYRFMRNGEFSEEKILNYQKSLRQRRREIYLNLKNYSYRYQKLTTAQAAKKAKSSPEVVALDLMLMYLKLIDNDKPLEAYQLAMEVLEMDYALKVQGKRPLIYQTYKYLKDKFDQSYINRGIGRGLEAVNLYTHDDGVLLGQSDLYERWGSLDDLYRLNPRQSSFWYKRSTKYSKIVKSYDPEDSLYKGVKVILPKNVALFTKVHSNKNRPAISIQNTINGVKNRYSLYLGPGNHADMTGSGLAAALGYHAGVKNIINSFKIILPDGVSVRSVIRQWNDFSEDINIRDYIVDQGITKNNLNFIELKDVLIEKQFNHLIPVGAWSRNQLGHADLRENRGMSIFNMWIGHNKTSSVIKKSLVLDGNNKLKSYHLYSDFSDAFSRVSVADPNVFIDQIILEKSQKQITFVQDGFDHDNQLKGVTYNDAKWMIRIIGTLSVRQIKDAVELGRWPKSLRNMVFANLINRRNQLVDAFDLTEQFPHLKTTINAKESSINPIQKLLEREIQDAPDESFKDEVYSALKPIYQGLESLAVELSLKMTSTVDSVVIDLQSLGYDGIGIAEVEVSTDRQIVRNLEQTDENNKYLVQDNVKIRFGLGVGFVIRGKANFIKEYKLVYPVSTQQEANAKNDYIFNAMLPAEARKTELPDNYVLVLQESIEGQGEVLIDSVVLPLSLGMSLSYGVLTRTTIAKKDDSYEIYQDKSPYTSLERALYAKLLFFRVPIWHSPNTSGLLDRKVYRISSKEYGDQYTDALDQLLVYGDLSDVVEIAEQSELKSNYVEKRSGTNIFGLINVQEKRRSDNFEEVLYNKDGTIVNQSFYQVDIDSSDQWTFFGNGELKRNSLRLHGQLLDDDKVINPYIDLRFMLSDKETSTNELRNLYLHLVDEIGLTPDFLNFSPELHSQNHYWGNTYTQIELGYNKAALDKLISTTHEEYFQLMAKFSNRSVSFWRRKSYKNVNVKMKAYKRKFKKFLKKIKQARTIVSEKDRYILVTDAINTMIWRASGSYDPSFIRNLNHLIGRDNFFMQAILSLPEGKHSSSLSSSTFYNILNPKLQQNVGRFEFDFERPEDIWSAFYSQRP